jgi:fucose permease
MTPLPRANLILLVTGLAAFLMMGMGQSVYGPALPAFSRSLGISEAQASLLISAHWIGCGLGVLAMFLAGPRIGPAPVLALMAAGAAGVAALAGLAATFAAAMLFGAGYGCLTVLINPRILRAFGTRGPAMVSLVNAVFGAGAIVAPLVFVWLGSDPSLSFALVAVVAAAVAFLALALPRGLGAPVRASGPFDPRLPLMVFPAAGIGCEALLIGLGPSALIAAGQSEVAAAEFLSAFFAAFLAARVGLIFTAHLMPAFAVYLGAMAGLALCSLVALLTLSPWAFVAMGACAALLFPGFYVAATQLMGDDPRVSPTIIAAGLVGGIFLPMVIGPLLPVLGAAGFFALILLLALAMVMLGLAYGARQLMPSAVAA